MISRYLLLLIAGCMLMNIDDSRAAIGTDDEIVREPELQQQLLMALHAKGPAYLPRTEHLDEAGAPLFVNRLILESSPYLLQHAHNPVDWYPWGEDAFAKAQKENKPVFLSIGYSTCHWCHVMERESFENTAIADILNRHFVSIKVDRESHPDVDAVYMDAVQLIAGHGGWPMSSFLTPDGKTFHAGTYYHPEQFKQLLQQIHSFWLKDEQKLRKQADSIALSVNRISASHQQADTVGSKAVSATVADIMTRYDDLQYGFSQAPKFPNESFLYLLLSHLQRENDPAVKQALVNTLEAMANGGMYDQIGGGFHRYSTDNEWLVPHFEKMLYNQANLARIYLQAWQLTGDTFFADVVRQTLDYVLREMTGDGGAFYSATDADTGEEEGLYFIWTPAQIRRLLDEQDAAFAMDFYRITEQGNFEGANILHRSVSLAEYATQRQRDPAAVKMQLDKVNQQLLQGRAHRLAPLRDDKVITAWNGMMITTLAMAGDILNEPEYLQAAERAAKYLLNTNRAADGRLWRLSLHAQATVAAAQEDYAYLAEALLVLFDITADQQWLDKSIELADFMLEDFQDIDNGGFYLGREDRVVTGMGRAKDIFDGAIASGNSVAFHVLQKLSRRTDNTAYLQAAEKMLAAHASKIGSYPASFAYLISGVNDYLNGESGAHQYAAQGAIRVDALIKDNELVIDINMQPGWHINSHKPLQDYLLATQLQPAGQSVEIFRLENVRYPQALMLSTGFEKMPLALYQGKVSVRADIVVLNSEDSFSVSAVELALQACNDKLCLPPERLQLLPLQR